MDWSLRILKYAELTHIYTSLAGRVLMLGNKINWCPSISSEGIGEIVMGMYKQI